MPSPYQGLLRGCATARARCYKVLTALSGRVLQSGVCARVYVQQHHGADATLVLCHMTCVIGQRIRGEEPQSMLTSMSMEGFDDHNKAAPRESDKFLCS